MWPRPPIPPSRVNPAPRRCGSSSGGSSPRPVPSWPSWPPTAITASSPTGTGKPWNWRPIIAATPRSRTPLKHGVGLNHLPSGRFAANGAWLAVQVMAHNLAPLDSAHRSGRTDRDHQDPQAAGLRSGGTDHPLGAPPYPASSPALALGNPVHSRHGPAASHSTPRLTASLQLTQLPCKLVPPRSARVPCCVFSRHPAHRSSRRGP